MKQSMEAPPRFVLVDAPPLHSAAEVAEFLAERAAAGVKPKAKGKAWPKAVSRVAHDPLRVAMDPALFAEALAERKPWVVAVVADLPASFKVLWKAEALFAEPFEASAAVRGRDAAVFNLEEVGVVDLVGNLMLPDRSKRPVGQRGLPLASAA